MADPDPCATKVGAARQAVLDGLARAEAAMKALRPGGSVELASVADSEEFRLHLENRIMLAAVTLQRLKDRAKRLLKRLGQDTVSFENSLSASLAIRVADRLSDAWKHGLGGQQRNATILNGVLKVHRADGYRDSEGRERVMVYGMMVCDAADCAFHSSDLLRAAVRDWAAILQAWVPEARSWAERIHPSHNRPVHLLSPASMNTTPPGSIVTVPLPASFVSIMKREAANRAESA
ncbi:MAG: hypothetical protein ACKVU4_09120 [Phycisphaerales bacterium]